MLDKLILQLVSCTDISNEDFEKLTNFDLRDDELASLMEKHKVQYLLFLHLLKHHGFYKIKYKVGEKWGIQLCYLQNKYNEYINNLKIIIEYLNNNNIPYVILKGFSIIDKLYKRENIIYRDFIDIDILIERKNVSTVNEILLKCGFIQGYVNEDNEIEEADRKSKLSWSLFSHQEYEYIKFSNTGYISPFNRIYIDINTTIFEGGEYKPQISTEELINHTITQEIGNGLFIKCLEYEYEIIQLCYHFYKDTIYEVKIKDQENFCMLKLCDIREYIIKYLFDINWNKFVDIINNAKIEVQIFNTLYTVRSVFGDLGIDYVMDKLKPSDSEIITSTIDNEWYKKL
ncbi:nucleotidyltransferase family protein [Anaerocolumna chitinilytica]|uniref:Nucleotidyltransferase family protein n=1 Tax=Anaerocolumna chitinilytica TaxID=1727145 RepID=A0A7M3SA66_9FIRM|nr:nucleotidyltransferase family protein [Anaerocolumna chitinilytica]BCK01484.1 hypothetical protein bsdcttw_45240 [Anaerocolumna chitinilytica]